MDKPIEENSIESHHQYLVIDTLLAGAIAGFVRDSLLYPIEVYQFARHLDIKVKLSTLTKGVGPVVIGALPSAAAFITTYSWMKVHLSPYASHERQYVVHMASAFAAELVSLLFKVPIDNIKKRHLTLSNQVSTLGITKRMSRSTGIGAFYKGLPPAVFSRIFTSLLSLTLWEEFMSAVKDVKHLENLTPIDISLCGAIAAGIAAGITTPLHVARTYFVLEEIKEMEKEKTKKREKVILAREREKKHIIIQPTTKLQEIMRKVIEIQTKTHRQMKRFNSIILDLYLKKGVPGLYAGGLARTTHITLGGFLFFYTYAYIMEQLEDINRRAIPCTEHDHTKCKHSSYSKLVNILRAVRRRLEPGLNEPRHEDSPHKKTAESSDHGDHADHESHEGVDPHSHATRPLEEREPPAKTPEEPSEPSSGWGWFGQGWFSKDPKTTSGDADVKLSGREEAITDEAERSEREVDKTHGDERSSHKTVDDYLEIARNTAVWLFGQFNQSQTEEKEDLELARKKEEEAARRRTTSTLHDYQEHEPEPEVHEEPPPAKATPDKPPWFNIGWMFGEAKQPAEVEDSKQNTSSSGSETDSESKPEENSDDQQKNEDKSKPEENSDDQQKNEDK